MGQYHPGQTNSSIAVFSQITSHLPTWWALPCRHLLLASFHPYMSPPALLQLRPVVWSYVVLDRQSTVQPQPGTTLTSGDKPSVILTSRLCSQVSSLDSRCAPSSPNNISQEVFVSWEQMIFVFLIALIIFLCYYPALNLFLTY